MIHIPISRKSTSIHTLNGDRPLKNGLQYVYYLLNWINNCFPNSLINKTLSIRNFSCHLEDYWPKLHKKSSPNRKLSDLFWLNVPWQRIKEELGEIHIFDTGCGQGNYGRRLIDWSNGSIASYTGIDQYRQNHWDILCQEFPNFKFHQGDISEISSFLAYGTNFFITQTAIEHFPQDLLYFEQLDKYIRAYKKPVIQIHIMPAAACLRLYGLHGIRQYTPRTLSKIFKLFQNCSYGLLYTLGGAACNRLHYEYVTKPINKDGSDLRDLKTHEYDRSLFKAISQDMQGPQKDPGAYALVIHSNWKQHLWPMMKLGNYA